MSSKIDASTLTLFIATAAVHVISQKVTLSSFVAGIYDKLCVDMTEVWYRKVLQRQNHNSILLDCGIGTSAALIRCKDIILSKNLKIIGIDYNELYVNAAKENINRSNLGENVQVYCASIYDIEKIRDIVGEQKLDAVYFSGSFSLLPNPSDALILVSTLLNDDANIYITQTYQRKSPPLIAQMKPLIKYVTTIDFGQLVRVEQVEKIFEKTKDILEVEFHEAIGGDSIDNVFQAAYLSILKVKKRR